MKNIFNYCIIESIHFIIEFSEICYNYICSERWMNFNFICIFIQFYIFTTFSKVKYFIAIFLS